MVHETNVYPSHRGTFKNVTCSTKARDALLEKQGQLVISPRK